MSLNIECHFKAKGQLKEFGENKLQKFYVDIDKESNYPSIGEFQIWNDKINISDLKEGDEINVHFNISGRKWGKDGKKGFAQSLNAWKIEKMSESNNVPENVTDLPEDAEDDLPF